MLSPYRIELNNTNKRAKKTSNTNIDNNSHHKDDLKRPQSISESSPEKIQNLIREKCSKSWIYAREY